MSESLLHEKMGVPANGAFPSAEQIRRAEIKFACTREDNVRCYYDKMVSNEDLNMRDVLAELSEKIAKQAFRGKVSVDFACCYASSHPRGSSTPEDDVKIYMDTAIHYGDGTYHRFEDYLDVATCMHAMCEFLFDFVSGDMGYDVRAGQALDPRQRIPFKQGRDEIIRQAFNSSNPRKEGFHLLISWGRR